MLDILFKNILSRFRGVIVNSNIKARVYKPLMQISFIKVGVFCAALNLIKYVYGVDAESFFIESCQGRRIKSDNFFKAHRFPFSL